MIKVKQIFKCTKFERNFSLVLLLSSIFLFSAYIGLVIETVKDVSFHKEIESKIAKKQFIVSELGSEYMKNKNRVNLEFAKTEGFVKANKKTYISTTEKVSAEIASNQ